MATIEMLSSPTESSLEESLERTTVSPESEKATPESTSRSRLDIELAELFSENVAAKIWDVASRLLKQQVRCATPLMFANTNLRAQDGVLDQYPESVPQTGDNIGKYAMREADFWTCGFFPGSMYALLERAMKYPSFLDVPANIRPQFQGELLKLARTWAEPLHGMATRTDTHDMGFIIQPALRMDWELTANPTSLQSVLTAAESLASRFDEKVGAIRSWDTAINKRYSYVDMDVDFLVIIDSMCSMYSDVNDCKVLMKIDLDLLYFAGHQTGNQRLIDIATIHAHKVLEAIVRDDFSTFHLINFDSKTGKVKAQLTNQGYKDWSTWSRYVSVQSGFLSADNL